MSAPFLSLQNLQVTFDIRRPGSWPWTPPRKLHAVNGVSLDLAAGECLGIVGESGSGRASSHNVLAKKHESRNLIRSLSPSAD